MELKILTKESKDIQLLEKINEEAIPECERNTLTDLLSTGATIIGIYREDEPVGFLVTRIYRSICYLAYFAIRSDIRSMGLGSRSLQMLLKEYPDKQVVVEYEAPDPKCDVYDINVRRKDFYIRNGFDETGWYTFYDETEFEIGCANESFSVDEFTGFTEYLSSIVSDHIPAPYRKDDM